MNENDVNMLRAEIESLIRQYPEIAEDEVLRADMLDGETSLHDVLIHLVNEGEDAKALREAMKARQDDLKARAQRFDRRVEFTRALMMVVLEAAKLRKIELPEATVFLRNNAPQVVGEVIPETLPDDLVKIERKPDRAKIKDALKAGRELPGLALSNCPPSVIVTVR